MPLSGNFRREMLKALKDAKKNKGSEENLEGSSNNTPDDRNDDEGPPTKKSSVVVKKAVSVSTQTLNTQTSKEDVRK